LSVPLSVPAGLPEPLTLVLRARRVDASEPTTVRVSAGAAPPRPFEVQTEWTDIRIEVPADALRGAPTARIDLEPEVTLRVDHVIVLPRRPLHVPGAEES
jgi:hypothetical protein